MRTAIAALCLTAAWLASADIILLNNGNRMEGQVVERGEKSITLRHNNSEVQIPRASIKEIIEQKTARQRYQEMLEGLEDEDANGHYHVALYCLKEGMNDEAVELLRQAVHLNPALKDAGDKLKEITNPAAKRLFERGNNYAKEGSPGKARECWKRITDDFPENDFAAAANAAIAESHFNEHNYPAATEQWLSVLKSDHRNTRAFLGTVKICERIGQFDKALEIVESVLAYEQDEQLRQTCGRKREAYAGIVAAQQAIAQDPEEPENYVKIALQMEKLELADLCVKWLEKGVSKGSRNTTAVAKLARSFDQDLLVLKALKCYTYLKELKPGTEIEREAGERIAKLNVLKLIPEYIQCESPPRRRQIVQELEAAYLPIEQAEAVLRKWLDFPEHEQKGVLTRTVQLEDGTRSAFALFVPNAYDPATRWPLILALHGQGGTGDHYLGTWAQHAQTYGCLVVAPTAPRELGWDPIKGRDIVLRALRDVRENFNIDPNRVYIDGASMGGHGAWRYGLAMPDTFAGLVSRCGRPDEFAQLHLPNASCLPIYIIHGMKDAVVPLELVKPVYETLTRLGCEVEYRVDTKAGHSTFHEETPRIMQWLLNRVRQPYPAKVKFTFHSLATPKCYWLKPELLADSVFDPSRPIAVPKVAGKPMDEEMSRNYRFSTAKAGMAVLNGEITGSTIKVEARHLIGYTILLNDRMLPLDKPIEVITNGKKSLSGTVKRSLPFMLEWARRSRDPEMIYSAYVRIVLD